MPLPIGAIRRAAILEAYQSGDVLYGDALRTLAFIHIVEEGRPCLEAVPTVEALLEKYKPVQSK